MSTSDIRPTTIPSLKRLANKLQKEHGIKHANALDAAAQQAGFCNYKHARSAIERARVPIPPLQAAEADRERIAARIQDDFAYGRELYRHGAAAPGFSGGNEHVIAGWLAQQARVARVAQCGLRESTYNGLITAAAQYTGDRGWAETLTMHAMFDLSELCHPDVADGLRRYADERYFAYGDATGY